MNGIKVTGGYGSLIAGILLVVSQHLGLPINQDLANTISGFLVMIGGGLLHTANPPKR